MPRSLRWGLHKLGEKVLKQPLAIEHRPHGQNDGPSKCQRRLDGHKEDTNTGKPGEVSALRSYRFEIFDVLKKGKNEMNIAFEVPGEPVAKGRARASTFGGHIRMHTPQKTVNYESMVAMLAQQAMAGRAPLTGPVMLSVYAVFQPPKSWSKKLQQLNMETPQFVVKKPDFDNVIKALCDGMNGVVWVDDSQVAALGVCSKVYGIRPRVEVTIESLT